ncbi:MAG: methyl-accepting chemotaxis protein [Paucimonas sp.]|jgi:methyl-accepting chemotaxis protein|nr:methyl-accepting chemotaxis protein [Paucimonas sp.]
MPLTGLSIKWRITLLGGLCLLGVVVATLSATLAQTERISGALKERSITTFRQAALSRLDESANSQALRVQRFFEDNQTWIDGFAQQLLQLQEQPAQDPASAATLRQAIIDRTATALRRRGEVLGLYVVFEPNALDGQDATFSDPARLAGNASGRFALYWSQARPGQTRQAWLSEDNILLNKAPPGVEPDNSWYSCPRTTAKACVVEPYTVNVEGRDTLMSSIALPLISSGKVIGVVGADIGLDTLDSLTAALARQLYDGQAQVQLVSARGLAVAGSQGPHGDDDSAVSKTFAPIPGARPWRLDIHVPQALLLAPALQLSAQFDHASAEAAWYSLGWSSLCALFGLAILGWSAHAATRPLLGVADALDSVVDGEGDLTRRLPRRRDREPRRLVDGFNRFLEKLQPVIHDVQLAATHTRECATRAAAISADVNAGMHQQHQQVEGTVAALLQMERSALEVADHSSRAALAASTAEQATRVGLQRFEDTRHGVRELDSHLQNTFARIEELAKGGAQIEQVLDVICVLAQKTNLLALNAAIEAARAGEQGRGFAVVADEVRHLASHTQDSTAEIREVIEHLRQLTREAQESMLDSRRTTEQVVERIDHAHTSLQAIDTAVNTIKRMNQHIASATGQQHQVVDEITQRMGDLRGISLRLTERMDESSGLSHTLDDLAARQQGLLARFRT